jgi:hypothetical protein
MKDVLNIWKIYMWINFKLFQMRNYEKAWFLFTRKKSKMEMGKMIADHIGMMWSPPSDNTEQITLWVCDWTT